MKTVATAEFSKFADTLIQDFKEHAAVISWQIDVQTMETVSDFIFLGSKITSDGDCSHEIKRRLLLQDTGLIPGSGKSPGEGNGNAF